MLLQKQAHVELPVSTWRIQAVHHVVVSDMTGTRQYPIEEDLGGCMGSI